MKSVVVELAGKTYTVQSLKFKAERAWRKKYDAPISSLINALSQTQSITDRSSEPGQWLREMGGVLLAHAGELVNALLSSPDTLMDAICEYSPAIASEREWIEENAYQEEIAKAFVEVLKIAYPFGQLLGIVTSLGSLEKQTTPSSPSPSGDSSKTT